MFMYVYMCVSFQPLPVQLEENEDSVTSVIREKRFILFGQLNILFQELGFLSSENSMQ